MDESEERIKRPNGPVHPDTIVAIDAHGVRQALENLYSNVDLANSTLAHYMDADASVLQKAQTLRNLLLGAIEALRPLRPTPSHIVTAGRSYEVLSLRYLSCLSVEEIAEQLSLGVRQVYRDLRRAEEDLADILQSEDISSQFSFQLQSPDAIPEEVNALVTKTQATDLAESLHSALSTIRPLIEQHKVLLNYQKPLQAVWIMVSSSLLKEVLIQVLSALVQQCQAGQTVGVELNAAEDRAKIRVTLHNPNFTSHAPLLQDALRMVESLGFTGTVTEDVDPDVHETCLSVRVTQPFPVLIVEDNPGACELYQRYLQGSKWRATAVSNPEQVDTVVSFLQPTAIILDILMPEMDGWSVLQTIKLNPHMADIPVIICSVIDDPELATALGAAASLKKPLSRLELIGTLNRVASLHSGV